MQRTDQNKKNFSVIGYGRFGKLWVDIISEYGSVLVFENNTDVYPDDKKNIKFVNLQTALDQDIIFLCIPISAMESFMQENASKISKNTTVIDMASVKSMPIEWMDREIPKIKHLGVHPLFGPDSYASNQNNLMIITPSEQYPELAGMWSEIFASWRFFTKIITPAEHDKSIAYSQGVTHFVGNVLKRMNLPHTDTPTKGYNMLRDIELFCDNDTTQLFRDMLLYNPQSVNMFKEFLQATHEVSAHIRKENMEFSGPFTLGVMGEEGSFSQEAGQRWLKNNHVAKGELFCLTTAERVYDALNFGFIQVGLMPIQNAVGGMVLETVQGLAQHSCKITGFFPFIVNQCLMGRKNIDVEKPVSIHSHPQALRQCKSYLKEHFQGVLLVEEMDTALSARMLAEGKLPENAYIIASETCKNLYGLKMITKGIQDLEYNVTDFVTVIKE
ncbi:MAG: prephenate dehydrogenase/arogenate dehydrogenase family protein [Candidatus Marinimicrobia bacterium]|nr:prephenate dehydrogenase/arogenate dehydrogenase family protein [Candidatus Neomarinimicrobiota bacterium]